MAVEVVHIWKCDGVCKKTQAMAVVEGKSNHPEGWRHVDGVVWCGAPACRDEVVRKYRSTVIAQARQQCTEFERVAHREEQLDA